jgi:hypothetical protein
MIEPSRISSAIYRPRVRRLSKSAVQSIRAASNVDFRSVSVIKSSHISSAPYRPRVKRVSQKDLRRICRGKNFKSRGKDDDRRLASHDNGVEPRTRTIKKVSPIPLTASRRRRRITPINQRDFGSIYHIKTGDSRTAPVSSSVDVKSIHLSLSFSFQSNTSSTYTGKSMFLPRVNSRSNIFDHHSEVKEKRKRYATIHAIAQRKIVYIQEII